MATGELYHESAGKGKPVVLLHPGFADSRIWDPQWPSYALRFGLMRCDLRGFGRSPIRSLPVTYALDVAALLDWLAIGPAALVGCSLGGRVAFELAVARPDLVRALVLVGAATPEALATAPEMAAYTRALMDAIAERDLEAAVEVNMRTWVDGPHRTPEQVDPELRSKVAQMQREAFINTRDLATTWTEETLVTGLAERLSQLAAPTLVAVGQLDMGFVRGQARTFAEQIPGAVLEILDGTAHAPNIERPKAFDDVVIPFLETV